MSYEIFGNEMTELHPTSSTVRQARQDESEGVPAPSALIEGKNAVLEALRAGKTLDKLFIQDGMRDNTVSQILAKVKGSSTVVSFVKKQRLDQMSETGAHQGIIAQSAAGEYATLEDALLLAEKKKEPPFLILLDEIEDPHNLGAIIRTANVVGAHGVVIPRHRAAGLTAAAVKASAGAVHFTPVIKVNNLKKTMDELKKQGFWFACADMEGESMYKTDLTGPMGLVVGNEGSGVSRLVKEACDYVVSIPMFGDISSLNASVAAGILSYEIRRQRMQKRPAN